MSRLLESRPADHTFSYLVFPRRRDYRSDPADNRDFPLRSFLFRPSTPTTSSRVRGEKSTKVTEDPSAKEKKTNPAQEHNLQLAMADTSLLYKNEKILMNGRDIIGYNLSVCVYVHLDHSVVERSLNLRLF